MEKIPATVQILTRNSEKGLKNLLPQLLDFAEILLIDGNSTDSTLALAKQYNCNVIKQKDTDEKNIVIDNFSDVRNLGLQSAKFDWQLVIDSDEEVDKKLVNEIKEIVNKNEFNIVYSTPRKFIYKSKIIDYSLYYPNLQIRFFNRLSGAKYVKPVHEKIIFDKKNNVVKTLEHCLYVPLDDYDVMKAKGEKYLNMSLKSIDAISFYKWFRWYFIFHLRASIVYLLRMIWNFFKLGNKMPLKYEVHIFYYNWRMIYLSFKKVKFL